MARIRVLPPETARLIAAGEVIDRPAALLRELIDNSIDAGATDIRVEIEGGGISSVLVADDGAGMDAEDLALSVLPHATSKIESADDLLSVRSLGFRGEALASIAAAARLEITTKTQDMKEARRLVSVPGSAPTIEPTHGRTGTRILVTGLFDSFPARRQFLKRSQSEAALCAQVFADKALPHPGVSFRFESERRLIRLAPAVPSLRERVFAFDEGPGPGLVYEIAFSGEGFEGKVVAGSPSWYRGDRRSMQVFVNRRRVQDWGLLSGLDWAYEGFLPGGAHPFAYCFVEVDPALADFNIHPAKREVRFRDPAAIRHSMTRAIRDFLAAMARARPEETRPSPFSPSSGEAEIGLFGAAVDSQGEWHGQRREESPGTSWEALIRERPFSGNGPGPSAPTGPSALSGPSAQKDSAATPIRLVGRAFGLFLAVERGEELFLIDQHAAHERLIYDEITARPPAVQELLVPIPIETETEGEERRLEAFAAAASGLGFRFERSGRDWLLVALPASLRADPEGAMRELLAGGSDDPARSARAMTACKAAIKDGDELDSEAALELARRALDLPEPRCPHGRPVWVRMTREELFRLVRRIV